MQLDSTEWCLHTNTELEALLMVVFTKPHYLGIIYLLEVIKEMFTYTLLSVSDMVSSVRASLESDCSSLSCADTGAYETWYGFTCPRPDWFCR